MQQMHTSVYQLCKDKAVKERGRERERARKREKFKSLQPVMHSPQNKIPTFLPAQSNREQTAISMRALLVAIWRSVQSFNSDWSVK